MLAEEEWQQAAEIRDLKIHLQHHIERRKRTLKTGQWGTWDMLSGSIASVPSADEYGPVPHVSWCFFFVFKLIY